jgi:hypothetical protein
MSLNPKTQTTSTTCQYQRGCFFVLTFWFRQQDVFFDIENSMAQCLDTRQKIYVLNRKRKDNQTHLQAINVKVT